MKEAIKEHFEYTRSKITKKEIEDFSPDDPGYGNYVKLWSKIWEDGAIPERAKFDLSEVIALTGWSDAEKEQDPERFRRYRRFTSSVGISLLHFGNDSDCVRPPNYIARDLLVDLDRSDHTYLEILKEVFRVTRESLRETGIESEYPYFTLGSMILAQVNDDFTESENLANQLIEDESSVRSDDKLNWKVDNETFLLGLSNYNQVENDWVRLVREIRNPSHHLETQLIIDEITKS